MLADYFKIGWKNIKNRKLRSYLTILGIVIGVAAIISLISVGQGLQSSITGQLDKIGGNRIYVMPKTVGFSDPTSVVGLTTDDLEIVESMSEFDLVNSLLSKSAPITYGKETEFASYLYGFPSDRSEERFESYDYELAKGRYFSPQDNYALILGSRAASDMFDKELRINSNVEIKGKKFKVIGILKSIGSAEDDNVIYMPLDTIRDIFDDKKGISFIDATIKKGLDIPTVVGKLEKKLERSRGEEDFTVSTPEQMLEQFGSILTIVNVVLIGIAAISLIVGGLGIMNSMYTSVLERTREIGIMKAIGARRKDILLIFLLESGLIATAGGVLGSIIGTGIGKIVESLAASAGYSMLKVDVSIWLILFGIVFAFTAGVLSGFLPARTAMKMKPVNALRY
ncbi:ABC transporter permease [Candidatus Woesearchaeota archaeon CG11_big_fil_rev_8_21_14_0_20_43_8]|nr:MAG: ABC transporter permease [Candidatus Woesearchaeota archaeon CG11_big_fil_rev_8_21_14_0_20_43_8]